MANCSPTNRCQFCGAKIKKRLPLQAWKLMSHAHPSGEIWIRYEFGGFACAVDCPGSKGDDERSRS